MHAEYCRVPCPLMREPCAGDLDHLTGRDDRDARPHHVAVQIEVHDVGELAVRSDLHRRREVSEHHPARERVVRQGVLPQEAKWCAMRRRHVVVPAVRRHGDTVGSIHVGGHDSRSAFALDVDATGSESQHGDLVRRLRRHQREILLRRRLSFARRGALMHRGTGRP
jgi:hypothetical protein